MPWEAKNEMPFMTFYLYETMGEAKRRKEQGLAPKSRKIKESKSNFMTKYPRLPVYFGVVLVIYLIFDWIKLNSAGWKNGFKRSKSSSRELERVCLHWMHWKLANQTWLII